jgi:hypothetical protein
VREGAVSFDDAAPLAAIRRSLTDARKDAATADAR